MISYVLKNDRYEMKVPALTFGAAGFERNDCDDVYFEFLDKYVELGGWCIDTARVYCDWLENGHNSSEGVIGRWLKARNNRDKICIATKGGHPEMGHMDESRLSREELTKDLEASLRVLGVDYVDIYFLHRDDPKIPVEEIMPVLNDFYESGKIHFIGVSNWTTQRIEEANKFAEKNGMEPIRISQINYSLAHSSVETLLLFVWIQRSSAGTRSMIFLLWPSLRRQRAFLQSSQRATLQTISLRDSMQALLILQDLQR